MNAQFVAHGRPDGLARRPHQTDAVALGQMLQFQADSGSPGNKHSLPPAMAHQEHQQQQQQQRRRRDPAAGIPPPQDDRELRHERRRHERAQRQQHEQQQQQHQQYPPPPPPPPPQQQQQQQQQQQYPPQLYGQQMQQMQYPQPDGAYGQYGQYGQPPQQHGQYGEPPPQHHRHHRQREASQEAVAAAHVRADLEKQRQREEQARVQRAFAEEVYDPWGKPGAGAPMRDAGGAVITTRNPAAVRQQIAGDLHPRQPGEFGGGRADPRHGAADRHREGHRAGPAGGQWAPPPLNDGGGGGGGGGGARQQAEDLQAANLRMLEAKKAREQAEKDAELEADRRYEAKIVRQQRELEEQRAGLFWSRVAHLPL